MPPEFLFCQGVDQYDQQHQGQEFAQESLEIVSVLKEKFPELKVLFDGGINEDTIENIRDAGVDVFCVGSYLTQSDFFSDSLESLKQILHSWYNWDTKHGLVFRVSPLTNRVLYLLNKVYFLLECDTCFFLGFICYGFY